MNAELVAELDEIATDVEISDAEKTTDQLFRYSMYVHEGEGAKECEHGEDGLCTKSDHFHAWIRLPNQFQHEDIQRKARAAKARSMRALRDPESDAYVILEGEIEEIREEGDSAKLIDSLVNQNDLNDRMDVMREVETEDEFSHRMADVERQTEIEAMEEEDRPEDELAELIRHGERYLTEVTARLERVREPRRAALEALNVEQLIDQVRDARIKTEGDNAFANTYTRYQWFVCTMQPVRSGRPQHRVFKEMRDLDGAAPEVVFALRVSYRALELNLQRGLVGNW